MTQAQKENALSLLDKIAGYGAHKSNCLTNGPEQTSEYCDCGYDVACKSFTQLYELLCKVRVS
jgi:hypothetical protein